MKAGPAVVLETNLLPLAVMLSRHGLSKVNFLKVDAKSVKAGVLDGADEVLHAVHKIAVDCGEERLLGDAIADMLVRCGFEVRRRDEMVFGLNHNFVP